MEQGRMSGAVKMIVCSLDKQHLILFIGKKEGRSVETDKTQIMADGTPLALLSTEREPVVGFEEELCDACVATASGMSGVLDGPGRRHVAGSVRDSGLENCMSYQAQRSPHSL